MHNLHGTTLRFENCDAGHSRWAHQGGPGQADSFFGKPLYGLLARVGRARVSGMTQQAIRDADDGIELALLPAAGFRTPNLSLGTP
jgi:hypothetical protein